MACSREADIPTEVGDRAGRLSARVSVKAVIMILRSTSTS